MNNFKTIIELTCEEENNFPGKIKMFNGANLIQNDPISNINIQEDVLSFRI